MMKKLFPIILSAVLILALSLSGCGGGNNNSGPSTPTSFREVIYVHASDSMNVNKGSIWAMDANGQNASEIIANPGGEYDELYLPSLSANLTRLAYLHYDGTNYHLLIRDFGSSTSTELTWAMRPTSIALSPDGKKLAYIGNDKNIYVITIAGNTSSTLTTCPATGVYKADYLTWSPDGTQIAFVYYDSSYNAKINKVNADGSGASSYGTEIYS